MNSKDIIFDQKDILLKIKYPNFYYDTGVYILPNTRPKRTGRKLAKLTIQEGNKPGIEIY